MRGHLRNARYEEIKKEVLFMFEESGTDSFPIDSFRIAEKLHYHVIAYSDLSGSKRKEALNISGDGYSRIETDPDTGMYCYVIYYNDKGHTIQHIRWTILHEIGHITLGHHDNPPGNEIIEEEEANFFAKYATAPPPLLNACECKSPLDVCTRFDTSGEFAEYAFSYFRTWLTCGPVDYLPYEKQMLRLFHLIAA